MTATHALRRDRGPAWLRRSRFGSAVALAVLILLALAYLYPFAISLATSFKTDAGAAADPLSLIPATPSTSAYTELLRNSDFPLWVRNSVIVTLTVTTGRVLFASLAGYALARLRFPGRGVVFAALVAVMAVPGVVLLIPRFLVINTFGIYNSFAGLILPLLVDAAGVFIMRNYFTSVPPGVEEAARIDGAGPLRIFWSVALPMAGPALITIIVLSFQGSWNELSHFIVASDRPELQTLTKGVAQLTAGALSQGTQYPLKLAAAVIMSIPVALLFLVFQRRITSTHDGAIRG
ncbi:carbohydrate ABC transporter permease [Occultella glacieicola]|uniref:Carbohydrate ABC transporter permease n=1 Tax=Occultella glacieicola TaxID=2518684 RepID=A0ABY2DYS5_9MICO|nr:carbohydrate ABC transporter permease [Occultella glacieicola]TDE88916.1 carbohydrate ABC transporter permease [Occultella glacieicola]